MNWYAIQVRLRCEFSTATILRGKSLEPFVPRYQSMRQWSDRKVKLELPLFPGYIFCKFDAAIQMPILMTAGVVKILGNKRTPLPVDPGEIAAVQQVLQYGCEVQPHPFIAVGDRVRIERGPLASLEGIVYGHKNRLLILSIALVRQSIAVPLEDVSIMSSVPILDRPTSVAEDDRQ